jgi:5-oxoprolinase (ATP-hydrolysing)
MRRRTPFSLMMTGNVKKGYTGEGWDGKGNAEGPGEIVKGLSGEAVRILKKPDLDSVRRDLLKLHAEGYRSLAIVFAHSYTFPTMRRSWGSLRAHWVHAGV